MSEQPTIALCMITRNEAKSLPHCLNSVRELVSEIVIGVDPTTSDNTKEVCQAWLQEWDPSGERWKLVEGKSVEEVGFGPARNAVLPLCTADWILILDSDERLPKAEAVAMPTPEGTWRPREFRSHDTLRATLRAVKSEVDLLVLNMLMLDDNEQLQTQFQAERLLRNGRGIRFEGEVHNYVQGATLTASCDVAILHTRRHRPKEEREYRAKQRLRTAEKFFLPRIEQDPEDARSLFYIAGSYSEAGEHQKAVEFYERYLDHPKAWEHERYQAAVFCARSLLDMPAKTKDERDAIMAKARRIAGRHLIDNYNRAELWVALGQIAQELGQWEEAKFWYGVATRCAFKVDPHFVEAATHTWIPWANLASVHFATGNTAEAKECLEQARKSGAAPEVVDRLHKAACARYRAPKELGVFIDRGDRKFIEPLIEAWAQQCRVYLCEREDAVASLLEKIDTAWFEWAGPQLIEATKLPHKCRMIVRVHGYEVHAGYIPQVDWTKVDTVIFVAKYLRDLALQQAPQIAQHCQVLVIPGGVQVEQFVIGEGKRGNKLAMAGYINAKKDLPAALEIFYEAKRLRPELELHIAGTVQDSREWLHIGTLCEELGLSVVDHGQGFFGQGDVHFYPWQNNLNAWFADKDYILSTSHEESFHYAVVQGMACGLCPVVKCWESSRDFFRPEWIYRTTREAVGMLTAAAPDAERRAGYRQYVADHLSYEQQATAIERVMQRITVAIPAPDAAPWRFENEVARVLEEMGFAPAPPHEADLLLCLEGSLSWLDMPRPLDKPQKRILWHAAQVCGEDELATQRLALVQEAAPKADVVIASVSGLGERFGATASVYQGGAKEVWRPKRPVEKEFDIFFYGSPNERREKIGKLLGEEWDVRFACSNDQAELAEQMRKARIVLNIHWTEEPNVEARVAEVLASGSFLLTEKLAEGHPFPKHLFSEWSDTCGLKSRVKSWMENEEGRERIARRGYDWVWQHCTVAGQVKQVLHIAGVL